MAAAGRKSRASWRCTTKTLPGLVPLPHQLLQMLQVAAPPARHPVRKERHPVFHPGDALDLHKQEFPVRLQDKIQPAALGYGNFGPDPGGQRQAREAARGQGLGHQAVGDQGVDADPPGRAPDKPPGIGGFAPRATRRRSAGSPDRDRAQPVRAPVLGTWTQTCRWSGNSTRARKRCRRSRNRAGIRGAEKRTGAGGQAGRS